MSPNAPEALGRALIVAGLVIAAAGLLFLFGPRLPLRIGRLPGDLSWGSGAWRVYIPLGTSLLLSLLLTAIFALVSWLRR